MQQTNFHRFIASLPVVLGFTVLLLPASQTAASHRQSTPPTQDQGAVQSPTATLSEEEQKTLIAKLQSSSQNLQTAVEYNRLIEQCRAAQNQSLSTERAAYVTQLLGWALCRRGERRLHLAADFAKVGNQDQANEILRQATADFEETLDKQPNSWRAWRGQGIAQVQGREWETAERCFTRMIELQPNELNGWFNRAEVRFQQRRFADAMADYQHVLNQQSNDLQAITGRGLCRAAQGNWQGALEDHDAVCRLASENGAGWINRGDAHLGLGHWKEALADFRTAADEKKLSTGWQRQAWLLAACPDDSIRDPDSALKLVEQSIAVDGESMSNLETKAAALAAKGEYLEAQKIQRRVVEKAETATPAAIERLELYLESKPFVLSFDAATDN